MGPSQWKVVFVNFGVNGQALAAGFALFVRQRTVWIPGVVVDPARSIVDRHPGLPVIVLAGKRTGHKRVIGCQKLGDAPVEILFAGNPRAPYREARWKLI